MALNQAEKDELELLELEEEESAYQASLSQPKAAAQPEPQGVDSRPSLENYEPGASPAEQSIDRYLSPTNATNAEVIAANPLVRAALGVASIPISLAQSLANVVDPDGAGQYMNDHLDKLENMKRRGMEARGTEYDMLGTAGEIAAPMGALGKMPIATNLVGKVAQGSALGGVLGGTQPITNSDDYEGDRKSAIETGAMFGAAVPVGIAGGKAAIGGGKAAVKYVKDAATPYIKANTGKVDELAAKAVRDLIGPEKYNSVKAALLRNENPLAQGTAGEVAVGANSTGLSKLQQAASSGDDYISQIDAKNLARVNAMKGIQGSGDDLIEAQIARDSVTAPMRTQALSRAEGGLQGETVTKGLTDKIKAAEGDVSLQGLLGTIQKNIKSMIDPNTGLINPESLYTFRKTGLDKTMREYSTKLGDPSSKGVMKDITAIKGMVDDAIEDAAGGGWKKYLSTYGKMSTPIERMQLGEMLGEGVERQVGGNARSVAKSFGAKLDTVMDDLGKQTGFKRSELSRVLGGDDMQQVGRVKADMGRDARVAELAGKGKANVDVDMQKLPNALIREVMVINNILSKASVGVQDKTAKEVSRLLLADPKTGFTELVKLMDKFPPKQKNKFLQMIAEETPMTAEMLKRVGYVTAGTQAGEL
tara:strand:- start:1858 stop:3801 length:1944 start_codon:yes stop_codon:yes gene_type:complete